LPWLIKDHGSSTMSRACYTAMSGFSLFMAGTVIFIHHLRFLSLAVGLIVRSMDMCWSGSLLLQSFLSSLAAHQFWIGFT
jgi:hypothetical protein